MHTSLASRIIPLSQDQHYPNRTNYINESTLTHLAKKKRGVKAILLTQIHTPNNSNSDIEKRMKQYGNFENKGFRPKA